MARTKIPREKRSPEYKTTVNRRKTQAAYMKGKKNLTLALPEDLVDQVKSASLISGKQIKEYISEAIIAKLKADGLYPEE